MEKSIFTCLFILLLFASCGDSVQAETSDASADVPDSSKEKTIESRPLRDPKVFYYDYTQQRSVEEALVMNKEDALSEMKNLPEADGNFFGMELSDGSVVQFMYDEKKESWFLDIPNPVTQESYNADITLDEAVKIVGDVFDGKSADDIKAEYK